MKTNIHPKWFPDAKVVCQCGNTWTTGATVAEIRTEICSNCHPFFTGEQRIVDTEGRVDKFLKRLQRRDEMRESVENQKPVDTGSVMAIADLGITARFVNVLAENGVNTVSDLLKVFETGGDTAVLDYNGIGQQALIEIKKALRAQGFSVPSAE